MTYLNLLAQWDERFLPSRSMTLNICTRRSKPPSVHSDAVFHRQNLAWAFWNWSKEGDESEVLQMLCEQEEIYISLKKDRWLLWLQTEAVGGHAVVCECAWGQRFRNTSVDRVPSPWATSRYSYPSNGYIYAIYPTVYTILCTISVYRYTHMCVCVRSWCVRVCVRVHVSCWPLVCAQGEWGMPVKTHPV